MRRTLLHSAGLAAFAASGVALADGTYGAAAGGGNHSRDQPLGGPAVAEYETGGTGALALGYAFGSGWRPEVEYGYRSNDNEEWMPQGEVKAQALMANLWYDLRLPMFTNEAWPFAGIGAGMADLTFDGVMDSSSGTRYYATDTVPAWQAGLGVAVQATRRTIITLGYRYFEAEATELAPGADAVYRSDSVMMGVRYDFGRGRPVRVAQAAPPPPQVETAAFETVVLQPVNFQFDESFLTGPATGILDELATKLVAHPDLRVVIEGHTDAVGTDEYNRQLGKQRADQVGEYLVNKGVERARIETVSRGESEPIANNGTPEGRATNRRAELNAPQPPPKVKVVIQPPSEQSVQAADDKDDPGR